MDVATPLAITWPTEPLLVTPVPIDEWEARKGLRRRRGTKKARRPPVPDQAFTPSSPTRWRSLVASLAHALANVSPGGEPSRHRVSLALAGALLARKVPAEAVPAIVHDAALEGGWDRDRLAQIRANACDTTRKWAAGEPIDNRPPQHVVAVLDRELLGLAAPEPGPLPEESLEAVTARLRDAYRSLPDGLSVFKAGCGVGKTYQAELLALERTVNAKRDRKTAISVPTNQLAKQITADLRARGADVLRVFGPGGAKDDDGYPICRFAGAARALAAGRQSVRYELCEGRGTHPCPYRSTCSAADGVDGPSDASIVVGPHPLVSELDARAGARGVLVIDEPPPVLEDVTLTAADLTQAQGQLSYFTHAYSTIMGAAVQAVRAWLPTAQLDEPTELAAALGHVDPELEALALEAADTDTLIEAVGAALDPRQHAPPIQQAFATSARDNEAMAAALGQASRVLATVHHALTAAARARVFIPVGQTERRLAVTSTEPRLTAALRRPGRVVVTAADADLHVELYREIAAQPAPLHTFTAPDGAPVRRVLLQTTGGTRANWVRRGNPPAGLLAAALTEAGTGNVAVVTFKALTPWARRWLDQHAPHVALGHYGALRGLDDWSGYDALITLGDPTPNLDLIARTCPDTESVEERAAALACAELEQAHGRLRTVHRDTPCAQIHVGRLVPAGWRKPIEVKSAHLGGRSRDLRAREAVKLVAQLGSVSAAARSMGVTRKQIRRWINQSPGSDPL